MKVFAPETSLQMAMELVKKNLRHTMWSKLPKKRKKFKDMVMSWMEKLGNVKKKLKRSQIL